MRNPIDHWSPAQLAALTTALSIAVVVAVLWMRRNDAPLARLGLASGSLQRTTDPAEARSIVTRYTEARVVSVVARGIAIDTALLVPSYAALLAIACFWAARSRAAPWADVGVALGWGGVGAGALDVVENGSILAIVLLGRTEWAPLAGLASRAKWALIALPLAYAVLAPLALPRAPR